MTAFEKACLDIYLSVHVSQYKELSNMKQAYWEYGQKIYHQTKSNFK